MKMRSLVSRWVPVIAWMVLIFAGSTDVLSAEHTSRFLVPFLRWLDPQISFATLATIHFALRKLGHLTEYGILAALLWRALRSGFVRQFWKPASAALLLAAFYAGLDEFHQSFIPTRTASERDVMIDVCGALVGVVLCLMFMRRRSEAVAVVRQDRHGGPERI